MTIRELFIAAKINSAKWHKIQRWAWSLPVLFLLIGCRHSNSRGALGSQDATTIGGDPATNVIIVPASAGWALRAGTNRLPAGITSPRPFPFPTYDQALVKSVYDRWHALLKAGP